MWRCWRVRRAEPGRAAKTGRGDGAGNELGRSDLGQGYFRDSERRDPFVTEIRVIDTYWSDHCRHTTFFAAMDRVAIEDGKYTAPIAAAFEAYQSARNTLYADAPREMCLMDLATLGMKQLKKAGKLADSR